MAWGINGLGRRGRKMKLIRAMLRAGNILLVTAGYAILILSVPQSRERTALFIVLTGLGILNLGYFIYFRKRFIAYSEEICRNAERIMRHEKEPSQLNRESLTSKTVMELEKMEDIAWNRLTESEQGKERMKQTLSEISHQLKTPLSNIRMYHDMIAEPDITEEEKKRFMEIIRRQLEKLEFLLDSLMKSSRLESEMIKLHMENRRIFHTLELAVGGIAREADRKNIDISVDCAPSAMFLHDEKWTAEAIENILDNAVKYTEENGKISVTVSLGEMYAEIRIKDTGRGIAPENYNNIFRRFYRENPASSGDGLGLGLYIARNIITLQGGYIVVHSVVGEGSAFSVFLPNRQAA